MTVQERNLPLNPPRVSGSWDGRLFCVHCGGQNYGALHVQHLPSCPTIPYPNDSLIRRMQASRAREAEEQARSRKRQEQSRRLSQERQGWS